ncbi:radical SAM/SPASM domain-containing protein [Anaerobacterium chartisolvens]|nr:radical SAM protein [Anaerobacterium chartisolvens]
MEPISSPDSKPKVISPWRIRNDVKNLVVYKCITAEVIYKVLSPVEAIIVPFFNGQNTKIEIYRYWLDINNASQESINDLTCIFTRVMDILEKSEFVSEDGELSPTFTDGSDLVPDFKSYSFPVNRLERPISVSLEITNNCATDCIYCYAERLPCRELDFNQIKSIIKDLYENDIYIVDVGGADVFTRWDAFQILEEMVNHKFVFFLSTKVHITYEAAERLAALGIGIRDAKPHLKRILQISIDSADSEIASFLVKRRNYLETSVDSVKNCVKAGVYPRIKCVLTSYNAGAARGLVEKFYPLGVEEFQFVHYGRSFFRHDDSLFLSFEDKLRLIETAGALRKEYPQLKFTFQEDKNTGAPIRKSKEQWENRSICSGGRTSMRMKPNGDIMLCEQIPHKTEFTMGNLLDSSVVEIWNSNSIRDFLYAPRDMFKDTACEKCIYFETCHFEKGYCYRDSLSNFNTVFDAPADCPYQSKDGIRQT